jgi:phosphatidylinositol alpha-mannosyltransferase
VKIALVSPYDFGYPGGVTEHVRHLGAELGRRGHDVHLIAPSSSSADVNGGITHHRIGRVVPIPANGSVARITLPLRGYLQAKRLLSRERFDIVHLHEPLMPALPLTVLRHSTAVNVGTFHAFGRSGVGYFYGKPMLRPFFRKLHRLVAVSRSAREFVSKRFPGDYEVVPNGIDFDRFALPRPPLDQFEDDRLDVLFVGRLEPRKGLAYLLRAWSSVRMAVPRARLIVVGGGEHASSYQRYARDRGWTEVVFAGHVSHDDLPRYYQTADVFCAPSTGQESFGIVLLEAMAAGKPIVATAIAGYSEVVTHGQQGLLVRPKESDDLTEALVALLRDVALRRELGERGQATARAYDWVRVADRVLDVYADAAVRHSRADDRLLPELVAEKAGAPWLVVT